MTGVLRNRLGIGDPDELEAAEADFSAVRLAGLGQQRLPGSYDLAHLQRFHERIFGDVYPWAGEPRIVGIAKAGVFCLPQHLESFAAEMFGRLAAADHLRVRDRETFIDGLTELLADLNALHPFREGNGRTQRAFCAQLAREAGHQLWWAAMDPRENVDASVSRSPATIGRCARCWSDSSTAPTPPPLRPGPVVPPTGAQASARRVGRSEQSARPTALHHVPGLDRPLS